MRLLPEDYRKRQDELIQIFNEFPLEISAEYGLTFPNEAKKFFAHLINLNFFDLNETEDSKGFYGYISIKIPQAKVQPNRKIIQNLIHLVELGEELFDAQISASNLESFEIPLIARWKQYTEVKTRDHFLDELDRLVAAQPNSVLESLPFSHSMRRARDNEPSPIQGAALKKSVSAPPIRVYTPQDPSTIKVTRGFEPSRVHSAPTVTADTDDLAISKTQSLTQASSAECDATQLLETALVALDLSESSTEKKSPQPTTPRSTASPGMRASPYTPSSLGAFLAQKTGVASPGIFFGKLTPPLLQKDPRPISALVPKSPAIAEEPEEDDLTVNIFESALSHIPTPSKTILRSCSDARTLFPAHMQGQAPQQKSAAIAAPTTSRRTLEELQTTERAKELQLGATVEDFSPTPPSHTSSAFTSPQARKPNLKYDASADLSGQGSDELQQQTSKLFARMNRAAVSVDTGQAQAHTPGFALLMGANLRRRAHDQFLGVADNLEAMANSD